MDAETVAEKIYKAQNLDLRPADVYSFGLSVLALFTENLYPYGEEVHTLPEHRFTREAKRIAIINSGLRPEVPDEYVDVDCCLPCCSG